MSTRPRVSLPAEEDDAAIREAAAEWAVKQDRGMSFEQRSALTRWLEADARHAEAWRRATSTWETLGCISPRLAHAVLAEAAHRRRRQWGTALGLAAAAAIALVWFGRSPRGTVDAVAVAPAPAAAAHGARAVTLSDGSTVWLSTGCEFAERFSIAERRVSVAGGAARFQVAKDPSRPFVVRAGGVEIRALGTAFNVNFRAAALEVLVTEGAVRVQPMATEPVRSSPAETSDGVRAEPAPDGSAVVAAGQRALIESGPAAGRPVIAVSRVAAKELAAAVSWQDTVLKLGGATLAELAAEFERRTGQPIRIQDAGLAAKRIGGRFRMDDVDGFVRVLEEHYAIKARRGADGVISLDPR